ncbi:MAG: VWA domain-containing protein, partial [Ignavibacteriaceae bacterium]|nr:VWA domain-containing protein [Ignavibacteriaceae bacterium]
MFRFANPGYLYALYAVPALAALFWYLLIRSNKLLGGFAEKKLHNILMPNFSRPKTILKYAILLLAITLLIISAADPQIGTSLQEVKQTGIDVYICLDVSLSMKADDIKPNRLEKAKYQISTLIRKLHGDRIGLVVFAGDAYVQFPLTTDYSAAGLFLNAVDFNSVPQPGTAIATAIDLAVKSFDYRTPTQKVIVLITDGEDHEGDIDKSVNDAVAKNIKIYCIGLGSPQGSPIPINNAQGQPGDFKKDDQGNTVITKLDEPILQHIASMGNGKYFRGTNYDDYLDKIYSDLSNMQKAEFGVKKI